MPSVLITGENSFVGNSFMKYSIHQVAKVVSLLDTDPYKIDFSGIDVLLHLAAIVHVSSKIDPLKYYSINRDLAIEVATVAKASGVRHFVFMSSSKVYGKFKPGSLPWNEKSACFPEDHYGKSKYEAEKALEKLNSPDFVVSIIRTPLVYGCGMKANMLKLVKLVKWSPLLPFAGIDNLRNYTYIENLIGFIDRIIQLKKPGVFIAMNDDAASTSELVKYISEAIHSKNYIFKIPEIFLKLAVFVSSKNVERLYGSVILNNDFTKNELSFSPKYSTKDGIVKMIVDLKRLNLI